MERQIYADFNATTPLCPEAIAGMAKAQEIWGNPSSAHRLGRLANELLEGSRREVARVVGAEPKEVVFTSGGSEANTFALMGSFFTRGDDFRLVTSRVEHSSVKDTVAALAGQGAKVEYVNVGPSGELDVEHLARLLSDFKPQLVSLMTANNETGVLFPIPRVAQMCAAAGVTLHTDAVQALGKIPASYWAGAALVSISAHKIHGPKGVGALVIRSGAKLLPTHYGGSQEIKRRGGTENTVGIAGFGGACARLETDGNGAKLRDRFESAVLRAVEAVTITGGESERLPNTSNVRFHGIPSEILLGALDLDGVFVSAGSACSSGSIAPSHVLLELGLSAEEARECVRFSFGKVTTESDVDTVAELVVGHVGRIRARRARTGLAAQRVARSSETERGEDGDREGRIGVPSQPTAAALGGETSAKGGKR